MRVFNFKGLAKSFIKKLLVLDPRNRFNARQALEHPFITGHCGLSMPFVEKVKSKPSFNPITDSDSRLNLALNSNSNLKSHNKNDIVTGSDETFTVKNIKYLL